MLAAPALVMKPGHLASKAKVAAPLPPLPPREPGILSPSPGQVIQRGTGHMNSFITRHHRAIRTSGQVGRTEGRDSHRQKARGTELWDRVGLVGARGMGGAMAAVCPSGASIRAWRKVPKHARNLGGKGTPQDGEGLGTEAGVGPWVGVLARVPW